MNHTPMHIYMGSIVKNFGSEIIHDVSLFESRIKECLLSNECTEYDTNMICSLLHMGIVTELVSDKSIDIGQLKLKIKNAFHISDKYIGFLIETWLLAIADKSDTPLNKPDPYTTHDELSTEEIKKKITQQVGSDYLLSDTKDNIALIVFLEFGKLKFTFFNYQSGHFLYNRYSDRKFDDADFFYDGIARVKCENSVIGHF